MKITVTQEHIDKGLQKLLDACPIALALRDATGHVYCVDGEGIYQWGELGILLPPKAKRFIKAFDNDGPAAIKPFEFEINL
jgi:hypothetical protein